MYAVPAFQAVRISFLDYIYGAPGADIPHPFIGLDNYREALTDPVLRRSFVNVVIFLAVNVPLTVAIGMPLAAALGRVGRFRALFRVAFFIPYVTASVAVVGVWYWMFSGSGIVNSLLGRFAPDPSWLINSRWAMVVIGLEVTWKQLGFYVLLYLAGILAIPVSLYEAAKLDGAGVIRQFWSITVPSIRNVNILVITITTIIGFNLFTEPYLLTGGGGPNGASMSPALRMYQVGIEQGRPDVGAAIGVLLTGCVLAVAALAKVLHLFANRSRA
jgi:multiple sugar transport system permease protein